LDDPTSMEGKIESLKEQGASNLFKMRISPGGEAR
jgi:hypothetical protein